MKKRNAIVSSLKYVGLKALSGLVHVTETASSFIVPGVVPSYERTEHYFQNIAKKAIQVGLLTTVAMCSGGASLPVAAIVGGCAGLVGAAYGALAKRDEKLEPFMYSSYDDNAQEKREAFMATRHKYSRAISDKADQIWGELNAQVYPRESSLPDLAEFDASLTPPPFSKKPSNTLYGEHMGQSNKSSDASSVGINTVRV